MLETAIAAAEAAGQILKDRFARPHQISSKGLRNLVTEADILAEKAIIAAIRARYPEHQILTEETQHILGSDATHRWIIDPLDGTTNYARGIPSFAVSVGVEREGELQAGVIYDPLSGRLFQAQAGQGAFLNGKRLHVSACSELIDALLDLGWARSQDARLASVRATCDLGPYVGSARNSGSAALGLAAIAAGWEDLYFHPELAPWDMAAGALLIREAGGTVTAPNGGPWTPFSGGCLASNGLLHEKALQRLKGLG